MRRLARLTAAAVVAVLALSGCATMTAGSHVERGLDFTRYRTYEWGPADALPIGDPRLDQDPFFTDHVQGAVEKLLVSHGFERATTGPPDLLVHYHAAVSRRTRVDPEHQSCGEAGCRDRDLGYDAGTLVLDIVDSRTDKLIWRGWAQDNLDGAIGHPARIARAIDEAVGLMGQRLPRGGR